MTTAGARIGSGREADVYAWDDSAVLKLYRPGFSGHNPEAAALRALAGTGVAPRLLDVVSRDGRVGLVLERIARPDMLTILQERPWRVLGLAHTLAQAHLAVHRDVAPADLPDVRTSLAARIRDAGLPSPLQDFALRVLDGLPDGDRLCHGDFHPGNVLVEGDQAAVIDWTAAARGVPECDHIRTLVLLRWADPLPDTPFPSRTLIAGGRSLLTHIYRRAYRRAAAAHQPSAWLVVNVAARLAEGIPAERPTLTKLLLRAQHSADL